MDDLKIVAVFIPITLGELQGMEELSRIHFFRRHRGLQARAAARAKVDPAMVSRVANGHDTSANVQKALEWELRKLRREEIRVAQAAG